MNSIILYQILGVSNVLCGSARASRDDTTISKGSAKEGFCYGDKCRSQAGVGSRASSRAKEIEAKINELIEEHGIDGVSEYIISLINKKGSDAVVPTIGGDTTLGDEEKAAVDIFLGGQLSEYKSDDDKPSTSNTALTTDVTRFERDTGLDLSKAVGHKVFSINQIAAFARLNDGENINVKTEISSEYLTPEDFKALGRLIPFTSTEHDKIAENEQLVSGFNSEDYAMPDNWDAYAIPEEQHVLLLGYDEQVKKAGLSSSDYKEVISLLDLTGGIGFDEESLHRISNLMVAGLLKDFNEGRREQAISRVRDISENLRSFKDSKLSPEHVKELLIPHLEDMESEI